MAGAIYGPAGRGTALNDSDPWPVCSQAGGRLPDLEVSPAMDTHAGNDSPPLRSTILGSFLRGRPRNSSQSEPRDISPSPIPPSPSTGSFAAVAALTGGTGSLITNAPAGALSNGGRRLPR